jgi:hypothetical protein
VHKAQGRTIDKVVMDLHYKKQPQKVARIWWNICCTFKSEMLFQHSTYKAHTHQLWRNVWIHFKTQASSWCDDILQRLHRQSTGQTSLGHATGTWFNQLIPSTLLYSIRSTNISSFFF